MSSKAKIGKPVPKINVEATGNERFYLTDLKGKNLVLYFYPKDDTTGCTTEGQDFRDHYRKFKSRDTVIYGVSRDSLTSHEKFKKKHKFPFNLISDEAEVMCRTFDVIREKSLYGKKYLGVDRSTFIIDKKGIVRREFRGVKVKDHVKAVLDEIKQL
jgi:peroxiredoxin Q/BCP